MKDTRALRAVTREIRAVIYLRLSDLREEDLDEDGQPSFVEREEELRDLADELGWTVVKVIIENDVSNPDGDRPRGASAFKRRVITLPDGRKELRTIRPGFREILDMFAKGQANGLLAEHLDRMTRDPRDGIDLLDAAQIYKINARSLSGSLSLTDGGTDHEISAFLDEVTHANKESRRKRMQAKASRRRRARKGRFGGGMRPFGFEPDGLTIRKFEADLIADHSVRALQIDADTGRPKESMRFLAAELRAQGVKTSTGKDFSPETWQEVLVRPRNAGIQVYDGKEIGKAKWEPIVPVEIFRALQRMLTDPARNTNPGPTPRWLGTGTYLCGRCNDGTTSVEVTRGNKVKTVEDVDGEKVKVHAGKRDPRYRCTEKNHLARTAKPIDAIVIQTVLTMLQREDAVDLFTPPRPEVDAAALRAEKQAIRDNLNGMAKDRALNLMDREEWLEAKQAAATRLQEIDEELKSEVAEVLDAPIKELIEAEDIFAEWEKLTLANQRAVVRSLVTVTILPAGGRGRRFAPDTVRIEPKERALQVA